MRAAVVIGVDRAGGGLPKLAGAASGARQVSEWLGRNDYHVDIFTDEDGPVERSAIFRAVARLVEAANVERLIVYFAGHGFLKGPLDECWLLSGAPTDPYEAVNVTMSAAVARYRGIPQVVFISDACRVLPKTAVNAGVVGTSIFPNTGQRAESAEVDFFYGTHPGDPALERADTEAERAHGLFTQELLEAHRNAPPEALLRIDGRAYVRNLWLKKVLRDRVDQRAQGISLALTQRPDVQIQIIDGYIAQNEVTKSLSPGGIIPRPPRGAGGRGGLELIGGRPYRPARPEHLISEELRADPSFSQRLELTLESERLIGEELVRARYSTEVVRSGPESLICRGDRIVRTGFSSNVAARPTGVIGASSVFDIQLEDQRPGQVAVQFQDGSGMLLPVLPEYRCEIVRWEGRTLSLFYTWVGSHAGELGELRAEVLTAATLGLLGRERAALNSLAERLRRSKRYDPILGCVAALAYAMSGDLSGAASVRDYMRGDLGVDLFDPWVLAGGGSGLRLVPAAPLLAQTWSFMGAFGIEAPDWLARLPRVPGFWTVFGPDAIDEVIAAVRNGRSGGEG